MEEPDGSVKTVSLGWLREKANDYVGLLDRTDTILGYRFVVSTDGVGKPPAEMGFIQYIENLLDNR